LKDFFVEAATKTNKALLQSQSHSSSSHTSPPQLKPLSLIVPSKLFMMTRFHGAPQRKTRRCWRTFASMFISTGIVIGTHSFAFGMVTSSNKRAGFVGYDQSQTGGFSSCRCTEGAFLAGGNTNSRKEKQCFPCYSNQELERHEVRFPIIYEDEVEALRLTQSAFLLKWCEGEGNEHTVEKVSSAPLFGVRKEGDWGLRTLLIQV
jgi:hypothetical protein